MPLHLSDLPPFPAQCFDLTAEAGIVPLDMAGWPIPESLEDIGDMVLNCWCIGHLDVVEHLLSGFPVGFEGCVPEAFALERREEALDNNIVMAVAAPTHRVLKIVGPFEPAQSMLVK